ncbi:MAG: hypothetical protein K0R08_2306 [Solimicrobium sp.]|jgi:hypothetical protein|nr:hypothetical protein [Solimicrobium sp.]
MESITSSYLPSSYTQHALSGVENLGAPRPNELNKRLEITSQSVSNTELKIADSNQKPVLSNTDLLLRMPQPQVITTETKIDIKPAEYSASNYMFSKYNPGISKNSQQSDYLLRVNTLKIAATSRVKQAVEEKRDLTNVFLEELATLGSIRNEIAVAHKVENSGLFGRRRDISELYEDLIYVTALDFPYDGYNEKLLPVIQQHLKTMDYSLQNFKQKSLEINYAPLMNRKSSMEISIFDTESFSAELSALTNEDMKLINTGAMNKDMEFFRKLKKTSPQKYKELKLKLAMQELRALFPKIKKSDWVLITRRLEVDGSMYAVSQYLTWMYRDFRKDPVENMTGSSVAAIIHQDVFLTEVMLNDIANLFKNIILCDGSDIHTLKEQVALFVYEFSHAMPFARGSAAVGEWLQSILFCYHGYEVTYSQNVPIDLEAQTLSLGEFVTKYLSIIQLEKIK